jgi:hypothetical protein
MLKSDKFSRTERVVNCYILCHFKFLTMIYTIVRAGAVGAGAGAASRYGSDQMMRLLVAPAPAPQHCLKELRHFILAVKSESTR